MSLTLGLTGMDPATETALMSAFSEANAKLGGVWMLVPESEAAYVIVDMDTLYGPMSWLRLHAADKTVIGLTTAARTQADFRLERPFSPDTLAMTLGAVAAAAGQYVPPSTPQASAQTPAPPTLAGSEFVEVASLARFADLADALPAATPAPAVAVAATSAAPMAPVATAARAATPATVANEEPALPEAWISQSEPEVPSPVASPFPDAPAPAADPVQAPAQPTPTHLADWLSSGQLKGRCRVRAGHLSVLVDNGLQVYFGPASLKPLTDLFARRLGLEDFEPVNDAAWDHDTAALGGAQPLSRLVWFGGLLRGNGTLASGYDPSDRYRLIKWPQTEREYPKHFRIATVMMKGPATLAEITEASGVTRQEVNDFVNANLATGFAEPYREPEPEPESNRAGGLFGRLRGR